MVRIKVKYTSARGDVTKSDEEIFSVALAGKSIYYRYYGKVTIPMT